MENRLKELRINKGLSMMQAAKMLDIPYTTYVNYEKGARDPNSDMLVKLANFYNCSIDYMIGNDVKYKSEADEMADKIKHRPDLQNIVRLLSDASQSQIEKVGEIIETLKK